MKITENLDIRTYCGNCLDVMKTIPDKFVDLILTDPPYGIGLLYDSYDDTEKNWIKLMNEFIPEAIRIAKMVIMPSGKINKLEWIYKNYPPNWLICWYKGSTGHASYIGFNDWEPHLVYGRTKSRLYMHDYFQTKSSPRKGSFDHPCPKPIEWANWIIERATSEGDVVFDGFMGSGTTAVACKILNRKFIGVELSKKYFEIAKNRINNVQSVIKNKEKKEKVVKKFFDIGDGKNG